MTDSSEIQSLLYQDNADTDDTYSESYYNSIPDLNAGSYDSKVINFSTRQYVTQWSVLSDSYLLIPINIKSDSVTPLASDSEICFKQSVLDFISGISITTSGGQSLLTENRISIINNLRLLLEKDLNWYNTEGSELLFYKNTKEARSNLNAGNTVATSASATNSGLYSRMASLKDRCLFNSITHTFSTVLKIPLKYLHDFCDKMDFPAINNSLEIALTFDPYCMFGEGLATADMPVVSIGNARIAGSAQTLNSCRLYYKTVKFNPAQNEQIIAKLKSGFTKTISYRSTVVVPPVNNVDTSLDETTTCTKLITQGVVRPNRLYCLAPLTTSYQSSYPEVLPHLRGAFTGNVKINNENWLKNSFTSANDWWKELCSMFPNPSSSVSRCGLLSHSEFISDYRIQALDLSRVSASRLADVNANVSITADLVRDNYDSADCDYWFVIERMDKVALTMDSGSIHIVTGINA